MRAAGQAKRFLLRHAVRSGHGDVRLPFVTTIKYSLNGKFPSLRHGRTRIGWGDATPSLSYGNTLREQRRMMLKYLNVVSSTSGTGRVQQTQVARFLKRLLITPESFRDLVHV